MTDDTEQNRQTGVSAKLLSGRDQPTVESPRNGPGDQISVWGWILLIVGIGGSGFSFLMPVTASYSDTLNIGLLQQQMMVFHSGLWAALSGIVCLAAASIQRGLRPGD